MAVSHYGDAGFQPTGGDAGILVNEAWHGKWSSASCRPRSSFAVRDEPSPSSQRRPPGRARAGPSRYHAIGGRCPYVKLQFLVKYRFCVFWNTYSPNRCRQCVWKAWLTHVDPGGTMRVHSSWELGNPRTRSYPNELMSQDSGMRGLLPYRFFAADGGNGSPGLRTTVGGEQVRGTLFPGFQTVAKARGPMKCVRCSKVVAKM